MFPDKAFANSLLVRVAMFVDNGVIDALSGVERSFLRAVYPRGL
jgi:hypothetical protein